MTGTGGRGTRALLFDFDGTIVDSEGPAYVAWQEVYAAQGHELEPSIWADALGTLGGFDPIGHLEVLLGGELPDRDDIVQRRQNRKMELVAAEGLRAGVARYLEDAHELGLKVAIVTSDSTDWITWNLDRLGVNEGWACIHCANGDRNKAKPDPYLYLAALERLGLDADQAVAIEDSPNGIKAAKAAGIFCVATPNDITRPLDLSGADVILDSLEDMPLRDLLRIVDR